MGAGECRRPCGALENIYDHSFFYSARSFFCPGLIMECSELEFFCQIASFERRLWGAAPTPLTLPSPFRTLTYTRMDAERDKLQARNFLYF